MSFILDLALGRLNLEALNTSAISEDLRVFPFESWEPELQEALKKALKEQYKIRWLPYDCYLNGTSA